MADTVSAKLLRWYDANARVLPWRQPPGSVPPADPYRVWLSEIMLQQTTVAAVIPYFERFTARWPTVAALAAADGSAVMSAWAGLGYYARARNLLACARAVVEGHAGQFPTTEAALRTLPGIGDYTAAAIAAIAFGRRAVVVDGNVERVVARLFAIAIPLPDGRAAIRTAADAVTPAERCGDFAQAMMDLGAGICTPRNPKCDICPLAEDCRARALGSAEALPVKAVKPVRPIRHGVAWWIERNGHVLTVRRPAKGLLGGMVALPSSDWTTDQVGTPPPVAAAWRECGEVRHVFTHFELRLRVCATTLVIPAQAGAETASTRPALAVGDSLGSRLCGNNVTWIKIDQISSAGFPTLFAKAARLAVAPPLKAAA